MNQPEDATSNVIPIKSEPQGYYASIFPGPSFRLSDEFAEAVRELETSLGRPLWLFIQSDDRVPFGEITPELYREFYKARATGVLEADKPIALLIDSPGGYAKAAFQIARLLQRHCGGFSAVIPRRAKSAATLLSLGADALIMGDYAELGPLDAQLYDPDKTEGYCYVIDDVQALERLHAFAMLALNRTMIMMLAGSGKRVDALIPTATHFVAEITAPLFNNIDALRYSQMSRVLKEAQEYAERLLVDRYGEHGPHIATSLVHDYPEHGFAIDVDEIGRLGIEREKHTPQQSSLMDRLYPYLEQHTIVGRLMPMEKE